MSPELFAALGWIAAALMAGLWFGERGRRKAAENWVISGAPDAPKAVSMAPSKEAEDRFAESVLEYSKETEDRGVAELMEEARTKGIAVNEADIRRDVRSMLSGESVMGP